jgi:hypothetical protein
MFGSKSQSLYSATAMLRINSFNVSHKDLAVTCETSGGLPINSIVKKLTEGIYRIEFEVNKSSEEFRSGTADIIVHITSENLSENIPVSTRILQ